MKKIAAFSLVLIVSFSLRLQAQEKATQSDSTRIELTGYIDTYYASYSNKVGLDELQPYITVAPRDNQFGLNIAEIGATYTSDQVRGTFVIQYGDIAEATWSERFRTIQEAWVGLELAQGLWLDAGFFTTHIGAESFLPKNNYLSSTDIGTFNEPFYQSGARLSYEKSEKFQAQLHLVTGYNLFIDNNEAKSIGMLLSYQLNDEVSFSYTNLFGRESAEDTTRQYRFYNNFYFTWDPSEKVSAIVGGDFSTQTNSGISDNSETGIMYNALALARYRLTSRYSTTARIEYFNDKEGFISGVLQNRNGQLQGLSATAITLGVELAPTKSSYVRAETRWVWLEDDLELFNKGGSPSNVRAEFMLNMGFYFNKGL